MKTEQTGRSTPYRSKRALDVALAAPGLCLAAPFMLVIAICIRLTSPGPAIHRAVRSGQHGAPFTLYKFRSMRTNSSGARITTAGDDRVTGIGKLLRATKLDELPQLVNVLRGDMSVVGPRPEDPTYVSLYTEAQREILNWKPGLTSLASIEYRHEEEILSAASDLDAAYAEIMNAKIQLDLAYFSVSSAHSDLAVIFKTVRVLFA